MSERGLGAQECIGGDVVRADVQRDEIRRRDGGAIEMPNLGDLGAGEVVRVLVRHDVIILETGAELNRAHAAAAKLAQIRAGRLRDPVGIGAGRAVHVFVLDVVLADAVGDAVAEGDIVFIAAVILRGGKAGSEGREHCQREEN